VKEVVVQGWNLSADVASLHAPVTGAESRLYLPGGPHG
jgi:hypothetical protein